MARKGLRKKTILTTVKTDGNDEPVARVISVKAVSVALDWSESRVRLYIQNARRDAKLKKRH